MPLPNYRPSRLVCYSLVLLAATVLIVPSIAHAHAHKNIVILLADDLGWGDIGFHGGSAQTPNIDRLAADGVRLNRFYAYPACSPARAAMLTGRFPQRYGIAGPVRPRDEGLPTSEQLLPEAFQMAGYQTSLIGKWHLGQITNAEAHPTRRGFDQFYGFMDASVDYFKHTGLRGQVDWQRNGRTLNEDGYSTDLLANEAVRQIHARDKRKPFCMVVSFNAPHSPFQAPETLIAKYRGRLNERAATYAAMIDSMDQGIGRILTEIDQQKLQNDTIVVFTSDNGAVRTGTNEPFRGQKREVYEGGIHVPCVIRAPGLIKAGTENQQLSAIHDLFPTLAEATGVSISSAKPLDGVSLWSQLVAGKETPRTIVIAENDHAIVRDDWKLIQFADGKTELYNLQSDVAEEKNLADSKANVVSQLRSKLAQYQVVVQTDGPVPPSGDGSYARQSVEADLQEGESLAMATLRGDAKYGVLGDPRTESNGRGVRLLSGEDADSNGTFAGEASLISTAVSPQQRWYRFYISGLAQDNFAVDQDDLYLKVEFFQRGGTDSLDLIKERIYSQVLQERKDFFDQDTNESLGHATWRTYAMDFRTPFAEVDTVKLSVGFANGKAQGAKSEFWVNSMDIKPIDAPANFQPAKPSIQHFPQPDESKLITLGGRWYFNPKDGLRTLPKQFDYTNSDQLLYKTDRFEAPFAGNMSSWLRAGYLDFDGNSVEKDQYKPYAVVITFTDKHLVMRSRNLPNHPTATFPDRWRMLDSNPSYIKEQANTWYIPLEPKRDPGAIAMDEKNSNQALPMGAIGVATNGVIFFNPFDHIFETDAVWRLDRCCGHPSPQQQYHYHKYPVCVKTPWSDEGQAHSSVIGFAFDGFPVYGPYESKGLLAKDDTKNPLNDFNLHEDADRGPHYHVTPGEYPHIIGGYWGQLETLNRPGRRR
ncbi:sulfatase-like hydrolase/transferase [Aporhodopirellula aestuarii]|uniref:Sulfatase-like hydrolase/transferase n=1 Tax=Aporhodopirellula aestuarii TaxID=2950107 RepID=A0ABT0U1D0_9BACT|nr:sulfatase-like hydrolase/transferase [Aporhodopirellula aestuarii]MCM2370298.1 sulfatase-like hydrolase/transferase [Aporhodopirellula aestuarii]